MMEERSQYTFNEWLSLMAKYDAWCADRQSSNDTQGTVNDHSTMNKGCAFCMNTNHTTARCSSTRDSFTRRREAVRLRLCINCLEDGHRLKECQHNSCHRCGSRHHYSLCTRDENTINSKRGSMKKADRQVAATDRRTEEGTQKLLVSIGHKDQRRELNEVSPVTRNAQCSTCDPMGEVTSSRTANTKGGSSQRERPQDTSGSSLDMSASDISSSVPTTGHELLRDCMTVDNESANVVLDQIGMSTATRAKVFTEDTNNTVQNVEFVQVSSTLLADKPGTMVMLRCPMINKEGNSITMNVLLDQSSETSFVSQNAVSQLRITDAIPCTMAMDGSKVVIKENPSENETIDTYKVNVYFDTPSDVMIDRPVNQSCLLVECMGKPIRGPVLTQDDEKYIRTHKLIVNRTVGSVVPDFIGSIDTYLRIVTTNERRHILPSGILLVPTIFGFAVCGAVEIVDISCKTPEVKTMVTNINADFMDPYSLERIGINDDPTAKADTTINEMVEMQTRADAEFRDGHVHVKFPWKTDHPRVADNYGVAYTRLISQHRQLSQNVDLWDKYDQNIKEQLAAGILEVAPVKKSRTRPLYFIPHQAVLKETSLTTKLRIVLDASSHKTGEISVNEAIHQGPACVPDIRGITLRARESNCLITCDIEKAFHQIRLAESDRDACTIIWMKDHKGEPRGDNLIHYRYTRIPFGINASPYLLSMGVLLSLERINHPLKDTIMANMYVDNVVLGADSMEECLEFYKVLKRGFDDIGMNIREFACSEEEVRERIAMNDRTKEPINSKILGTYWNTERDTIRPPFKAPTIERRLTKRTMFKATNSSYDPLGILSPLLIRFRIILSESCRNDNSKNWDTEIPNEFKLRWDKLVPEVQDFYKEVPRQVSKNELGTKKSLIVFCSATNESYGCVAYVLTQFPDDRKPICRILTAKVRVNPKGSPLLRLHLLAALKAAYTIETVNTEMKSEFHEIYVLSDSQVCLKWIQDTNTPKQYVKNRVLEIRRVADVLKAKGKTIQFLYVPREENPAELGCRGLSATELLQSTWWEGSGWLVNDIQSWPIRAIPDKLHESDQNAYESELKCTVCMVRTKVKKYRPSDPLNDVVVRYDYTNDINKLLGIGKVLVRFILMKCWKPQDAKNNDIISKWMPGLEKCDGGRVRMMRNHMSLRERLLMCMIREHQTLHEESILKFNKGRDVYKDENGVWRFRGRVSKDGNEKHPCIIERSHRLATLLMIDAHRTSGHKGIEGTICELRKLYWITDGGRAVAKKISQSCVGCKRYNSHAFKYPIAPHLPESRLRATRPFTHCGLDYAGPLRVRPMSAPKDSPDGKAWFMIMTCLTTRAIHLELVANCGTAEFVIALNRFMSRYGVPKTVLMDNAPTFQAGANLINTWINNQATCDDYDDLLGLKAGDIEWHHTTPYSPWKGGVYERLIGSVKTCLKKVMGSKVLGYRALETLLMEVAMMVNRRPITKSSSDPSDKLALCPEDFLVPYGMCRLRYVSSTNSDDEDYELPGIDTAKEAKVWRTSATKRLEDFYIQWESMYLNQLRERNNSLDATRGNTTSPSIGEVVLCTDEKSSRDKWKLAKVVELLKSDDGEIRKVLVQNPTRQIVEKSVKHLVPLEINCADPEESCKYKDTIIDKGNEPQGPTLRPRTKKITYSDDATQEYDPSTSHKATNGTKKVTFSEKKVTLKPGATIRKSRVETTKERDPPKKLQPEEIKQGIDEHSTPHSGSTRVLRSSVKQIATKLPKSSKVSKK